MILQDLIIIKNLSTKKDKAEALDEIANRGEVYSKLLHIIFDKDIRFYVDTDKLLINTTSSWIIVDSHELDVMLYNLLHTLGKGELRGNEGIKKSSDYINKVLDSCGDPEIITMFTNILDNKTRLGIGATDINKLCKFINIPQFEVMYAKPQKKAKVDWQKAHVIQPKIDGMRMIVDHEYDKGTKAFSRGGEEITSVNHILNEIKTRAANCGMMIDGEIEKNNREETGSVRRKTEQVEDAIYTVFGIYPLDEWRSGQYTETYEQVLRETEVIFGGCGFFDQEFIRLIPSYKIEAKTEEEFWEIVNKYFNEFLELGYEGYVLKTLDHKYQPSSGTRRSNDWVKGKPKEDIDCIVIGLKEGEGDHKGMVGKFVVSWLDVKFDVSPGRIPHNQRKAIYDNPELVLNKKLKVQYQNLSKYGVPSCAFVLGIREKGD